MNADDFKSHVVEFVEKQLDLLLRKNGGYNDNSDALRNFKVVGALNHQTPKQALWGMASKHVASVADMIASGQEFSGEIWDEKVGDVLNFMLLLRALVDDEEPLQTVLGGPVINLTQVFEKNTSPDLFEPTDTPGIYVASDVASPFSSTTAGDAEVTQE